MRRKALSLLSVGGLIITIAGLTSVHAASASVLDINYLDAHPTAHVNVTAGTSIAQSFTPTMSGDLTSVSVVISDVNQAGTLTVAIEGADLNKLPNGSRLASRSVSNSLIPNTQGVVAVSFSAPITVQSGSRYTLVLQTADGDFEWYRAMDNYPDEIESANTGGGWIQGPSINAFGVYVTAEQTNSRTAEMDTPPSQIQQFGRPADSTCDQASPEGLNWSGVSAGGWGESWARWMNNGLGGAVCTRMLVYSNAQGRWVLQE